MHDLKVWPKVKADPNSNTTTPGKTKDGKDQMTRLSKVRLLHSISSYFTDIYLNWSSNVFFWLSMFCTFMYTQIMDVK